MIWTYSELLLFSFISMWFLFFVSHLNKYRYFASWNTRILFLSIWKSTFIVIIVTLERNVELALVTCRGSGVVFPAEHTHSSLAGWIHRVSLGLTHFYLGGNGWSLAYVILLRYWYWYNCPWIALLVTHICLFIFIFLSWHSCFLYDFLIRLSLSLSPFQMLRLPILILSN